MYIYIYIYMGKVNYIEIIVCIYYTFILSYAKVCVMRILLRKRRHPSFDIAWSFLLPHNQGEFYRSILGLVTYLTAKWKMRDLHDLC